MRYKPKSSAALNITLGGLPAQMRVEVESGIEVRAKTVGELRKVAVWPDNLVITTPQERYPESAVRVSKVSFAARTSPKS
jgi:translation initiation factor IF-1